MGKNVITSEPRRPFCDRKLRSHKENGWNVQLLKQNKNSNEKEKNGDIHRKYVHNSSLVKLFVTPRQKSNFP